MKTPKTARAGSGTCHKLLSQCLSCRVSYGGEEVSPRKVTPQSQSQCKKKHCLWNHLKSFLCAYNNSLVHDHTCGCTIFILCHMCRCITCACGLIFSSKGELQWNVTGMLINCWILCLSSEMDREGETRDMCLPWRDLPHSASLLSC